MIKIVNINIKRFRSILDLNLDVSPDNDFISICGQNNTGKTNVLRAIRLFFNPALFNAKEDCPYYKYFITRGSSVYPSISLTFLENDGYLYSITQNFDLTGLDSTSGYKILNGRQRGKEPLNDEECSRYINSIKFYFVESINISIPDLINDLTEGIFDVEYSNSVFKGAKAELKKAFDNYVNKLNAILDDLSNEITPMFHEFEANWNIAFKLESDVKKFRDLVSTDISFDILDGSKNAIESKGAGLQRLAFILLHIRIIEKMKGKNVIFMIDEPDVFLHPGLQRKLCDYLRSLNEITQVFVTTHSKMFIDTYKLSNVFLLELNISEINSERGGKSKVLKTTNVPLDEDTGARKIKQYLGIEDDKNEVLQPYNIIVEGDSDKKYLSELIKYFKINLPNIISINGADNLAQYLEYYNSLYFQDEKHPILLVLLDNDSKGREVAKKIISNKSKNKYENLDITFSFIPNFLGEIQNLDKLDNIHTNNEIEDFMYPSVICYLLNNILNKRKMKAIKEKNICEKINKPAFKYKGILDLCENEKNTENPETGNQLVFTLCNRATDNIKTSMANMFKIELDYKLIQLIEKSNEQYPSVKEFVEKIANNSFK